MIFKGSYIVTETDGDLRAEPSVGTRLFVVLAAMTVTSVLLGVAGFATITSMRQVDDRVAWTLQSPRIVKTISRSVAPSATQAAAASQRGS